MARDPSEGRCRLADGEMTEEPPSTSLEISVLMEDPLWTRALPEAEVLARRSARAAWTLVLEAGTDRTGPCEAAVVLADDALVADLNRRYRGRCGPTNVLSFADPEPAPAAASPEPRLLGDVVLARETIAREAEVQHKPLSDHFAHLVVHGLLHLLGYGHGTPEQAEAMEELERRVLAGLGIADPYRESAGPRTGAVP